MSNTLRTKLYSSVVALSVGLSGCYGAQSGVLRGQDSLLQDRLLDSEFPSGFQTGFERFYHAGSLEHKLIGSIADKSGPCPPYLPNCPKKKEEKKNTDEDDVMRESSPYRSSPAAPSSEKPVVSSKGCGTTCVTTGYIVSGVGLLLLGAALMSSKTYGTDIKSDNYSNSEGVVIVGGIALLGGLGLTIYGHATKD